MASFAGDAEIDLSIASELGDMLYEPDPAILAAGLTGALAAERRLAAVGRGIAYLSGPTRRQDALLAAFGVREVMPLDRKRLAGWLAERRIGRLEIKCRGVDLRPEDLRKQLRPKGDGAVTLLVWPDADRRVRVAIADRIPTPSGQ